MLEASKLPNNLWAEAISHYVWIRNRVPTRTLRYDKTPLEMATSTKPNLSGIHPWGCKAWVKRLDVGKLESRAEECRFVGFDSESKAFRVYWPGKNRVSIERDVYFNEKEVLESDEVQIEGDTDILTNSTLPQLSRDTGILPSTKTNPDIAPNDTETTETPPETVNRTSAAKTSKEKLT